MANTTLHQNNKGADRFTAAKYKTDLKKNGTEWFHFLVGKADFSVNLLLASRRPHRWTRNSP